MTWNFFSLSILFFISYTLSAQKSGESPLPITYKNRSFQFSLFPGMGTNGINCGNYQNFFSYNLFSGYSGGNHYLEIGTFSNFNQQKVSGIQIAGFTNIMGGNTRMHSNQKEKTDRALYELTPLFQGIQLAGMANIVRGNAIGAQISLGWNYNTESLSGMDLSGLFNLNQGAIEGVQISGFANYGKSHLLGIQASTFSNIVLQSVNGIQISGGINFTKGTLSGIQIGSLNIVKDLKGPSLRYPSLPSSFQIGVLNSSKNVNGYQIGLINLSKKMEGKQIGMINLSKEKEGKSFGLINVASQGEHFRVYTDETFVSTLEIATGNRKKSSPVTIQNSLILGYNLPEVRNMRWGIGYGISKLRYSMDPLKDFRFWSYELQVLHLNKVEKPQKELSLLTRIKISAGTKVIPKLPLFFLAGVSLNMYVNEKEMSEMEPWLPSVYSKRTGLNFWPGILMGIHFH